jgi:hypothetical protein
VKDVLISVLREESVIIRLVTAVKPNATDVPPRANKRAKMEGYVAIPSDFWRC